MVRFIGAACAPESAVKIQVFKKSTIVGYGLPKEGMHFGLRNIVPFNCKKVANNVAKLRNLRSFVVLHMRDIRSIVNSDAAKTRSNPSKR